MTKFKAWAQLALQDNFLLIATLIYMQIPVALFLVGWLKWYFALGSLGLLVYSNWKIITGYQLTDWSIKSQISLRLEIVFICLLIGLLWLFYSGIGSIGFQNGDYQKHMAMFYDLTTMDWPLAYKASGYEYGEFYAVYYFAYYLPAALIGKLLGFKATMVASFFWSALGLGLVFCWLSNMIRRVSIGATLIFIFFSGWDFIGQMLVKQNFPTGVDHIEWWAKIWQFSSNTSLLYWVPQHALSGWLMTFLFLKLWRDGRNHYYFFLLVPVLIWSPFVALGLFPLALIGTFRADYKNSLNFTNLLSSLALGLLFCSFLLSKLPDPYAGVILKLGLLEHFFPNFWLFLLLEVGLFIIFLFDELRVKNSSFNHAFWTSFAFIVLTLGFRYGMYNDLSMRASIPGLCILCLAIIRHFYRSSVQSVILSKVMVLLILVGALNPMQEIIRSVAGFNAPRFPAENLPKIQTRVARQYVAKPGSLFFQFFAAKPNPMLIDLSTEMGKELEKQGVLLK